MIKICKVSGKKFEITDEDLKFYEKMDVPPPTLCPEERERRRLSHRGKNFYIKLCDNCQKSTMSWFAPSNNAVKVYCEDCFSSESFDATCYGKEYDFDNLFFDQFSNLQKEVPRHISNSILNENSEYILCAHRNKNCYLCDELDGSLDCMFGYNIQYCKNIVDSLYVRDSEIGYDLIKAENCYSVFYSKNVFNCSNSAFLLNCRSVKNCLFCTNLRNKEYYIFNEKSTKEECEKMWKHIFHGDRNIINKYKKKFQEFIMTQYFPAALLINTENCSGDYITNSKNVKNSFCVDNCKDCNYCVDIHHSNDCYDTNIYEGDLFYEVLHGGPKGYMQRFSTLCWFSSNVDYCLDLRNCKNCFGCISLKKKEYCILNKQYTQEEYEKLVPKIIEHMKSMKEYGEFFPIKISPQPYNHTMAQRFYPLSKEKVLSLGWAWTDEVEAIKEEAERETPLRLNKILGNILEKVFLCKETNKKYKITPQELEFYKKWGIPLPTQCPVQRIENLWRKLGKRKLYKRNCTISRKEFQTTFSPEFGGKVVCNEEYLKLVT